MNNIMFGNQGYGYQNCTTPSVMSNRAFVQENAPGKQMATVYIDIAELLRAYVDGCKEMFELGKAAAELGKISNQNARKMLMASIDDEERRDK